MLYLHKFEKQNILFFIYDTSTSTLLVSLTVYIYGHILTSLWYLVCIFSILALCMGAACLASGNQLSPSLKISEVLKGLIGFGLDA